MANLPKIPFFENLWSTAAGGGFTATQAVAKDYQERSNPGDFTNVLNDMDNIQACSATGSTFSAAGKITKLGCGVLGPNAMWSPQFSALSAWSSLGSGAYHSMQWTVRKRFSDGIQFDLNYTFSKSIDLASRSENSANFSSDFMINSWDPSQLRGVSRYDVRHSVNAFLVWQLPFGRGAKFGRSMNRVLDAFVGGWQIAGTYRQTSGLPFSISDGSRWATNWELSSFAVPNGQTDSGDGERSQHSGGGRRTESVDSIRRPRWALPGGTGRADGQPQHAARRRLLRYRYRRFQELLHALVGEAEAVVPLGSLQRHQHASASTRTRRASA